MSPSTADGNPFSFAIIGAGGYVAPRHMMAVRDTGNTLVAALDPNDSVGVLDGYFPESAFFVEFERFDRHLDLLRRGGTPVQYVSICSPNYLHDSHIRFSLRSGANAICEKPLVLNPWNIDPLIALQEETGCRVNTILQLRLHPSIKLLKERVAADTNTYDVDLSYITSRGAWYQVSWKGDEAKSGGIATNIGVHFFDMLGYVFGNAVGHQLHESSDTTMAGYSEFERARVRWLLSVDSEKLPPTARADGKRTFRSVKIGGDELEFSTGFTDLHTESYRKILSGNGFSVEDSRGAIEIVSTLRHLTPSRSGRDYHPLLNEAAG